MIRLGLASAVTLFILSGGSIFAQESQQPDPTIQYLISTPTTLMDKGVWEIRSRLDELNTSLYWTSQRPAELLGKGKAIENIVHVSPDRIVVGLYVGQEEDKNARATCHATIRIAQDALGFLPEESGPTYMAESLQEIFSHYGYSPVGHPSNLGNRLLGLFAMEAFVRVNGVYCHTIGSGPIQDGELIQQSLD